jgi:hypothetical protein
LNTVWVYANTNTNTNTKYSCDLLVYEIERAGNRHVTVS